ncbi:F-box domain, cyclin-like protein [Fusarium austroafricanum]|uniref:F-box domain, cyclin-like protein n=1 Tax=Fusarium austroafricanum TaxID=2364996 RepID=A0A8H4NV67_9HYPO|nr:F-box domain, cyclin-like protein [Fusarium austroafricanum]
MSHDELSRRDGDQPMPHQGSLHSKRIRYSEKLAHHVAYSFKKLNAKCKSREQQPEECFILQRLPKDLILQITKHLPVPSVIALSITCSAFKKIFCGLTRSDSLVYQDKLDLITLLVRDQPHKWACDRCCTMHRVSSRIKPTYEPSTDIGPYNLCICQYVLYHSSLLCPCQKYVQLALKYTRLEVQSWRHRRILNNIMSPKTLKLDLNQDYKCWRWPKIVDGRFLLATKWTHEFFTDPSTVQMWFYLSINVHIFPCRGCTHFPFTGAKIPACQYGQCNECEECQHWIADKIVRRNRGEFLYAWDCTSPTDYAFRASGRRGEIYTWQDLGRERPYADEAKQRKTRGGYKGNGVRELFERDGEEWLSEEEFRNKTMEELAGNVCDYVHTLVWDTW